MENGPFEDIFPIKHNMGIFHCYVSLPEGYTRLTAGTAARHPCAASQCFGWPGVYLTDWLAWERLRFQIDRELEDQGIHCSSTARNIQPVIIVCLLENATKLVNGKESTLFSHWDLT